MSRRDEGLDRLLDLDGFIAEVGGGFWVKIVARRVPPDADRPHGVSCTLTLHDYLHRGESVRPYAYRDADPLMDDFWREVEAVLKREGVE